MRAALAFVIAAALIVSAPVLWTSFIGDDAYYAAVDGWLAAHHANLITAFWREFVGDDIHEGRLHPLFIALTILEFHLAHEPLPVKIAQWLAVGANVATVFAVVRELTRSARAALVGAILAVLTLQTRFVNDGTIADTLHLQLTAECGLLAVWLLARTLHGARPALFATLSVLMFGAATLFYEIMLPLVLPLVVLAATARRPAFVRIALALPFVLVAAADALALAEIRHAFPQAIGTAYAPNLDPAAYVHAAALQLVSVTPLLYELVDPSGLFHATGTYWTFVGLIAVAVLAALDAWLRQGPAPPRLAELRGRALCLLSGSTIFVGPALLVAASPTFQRVIALGKPYAPGYIQGLGLAVACAAFAPDGVPSTARRRAWTVAGAAAFAVLFTSNVLVAGHFGYWKYPRTTIEQGLVHGTARDIPAGATIFLDDSYAVNNALYPEHMLWSNSMPFYRLWGGRVWDTRPIYMENLTPGQRAYEIRSVLNDAGHGTLVAEEVEGRAAALPPRLLAATIYERGTAPAVASVRPTVASSFAQSDFTAVDGGSGWVLTAFRPHCADLSHDALVANAPSVATIAYGDGFSVTESDGNSRWRWGGLRSTLAIVNATAVPIVAELSAGIGTVGSNAGNVTVTWPRGSRRTAIDAHARAFRIQAAVPARGRTDVVFSADAPNAALGGDARDLRFRLVDATLEDRVGCAARDAG